MGKHEERGGGSEKVCVPTLAQIIVSLSHFHLLPLQKLGPGARGPGGGGGGGAERGRAPPPMVVSRSNASLGNRVNNGRDSVQSGEAGRGLEAVGERCEGRGLVHGRGGLQSVGGLSEVRDRTWTSNPRRAIAVQALPAFPPPCSSMLSARIFSSGAGKWSTLAR